MMGGRGSHSGIRSGGGGFPVMTGRRSPAGLVGGGGAGGAGGGSPPVPASSPDARDRIHDPNTQQGTGAPGGPNAPVRPAGAVPASLENFETYQRDWEHRYFQGISAADRQYLKEQFQKVFESNGFYMNINSRYLENVADEHFKNQFETGGNSGGAEFDASDMTPSNGRVDAAVQLFGLDYTKMRREDYEKYGSMQTLDLATAASRSPSGYGDALVRFKKENVWERTTYTIGDSLGPASMSDLVAGKVSSGQFTGIDINDSRYLLQRVKQAESLVTDAQRWDDVIEGDWGSYLEVQYHGALTMNDVECIVFTRPNNIPNARVLNKLRSFGVKLYKYEGGRIRAL